MRARLEGPESMDWENRCCHTSAFPRNRWECICEVKAMPFSEFLKEDFADTFPEWKADPGNWKHFMEIERTSARYEKPDDFGTSGGTESKTEELPKTEELTDRQLRGLDSRAYHHRPRPCSGAKAKAIREELAEAPAALRDPRTQVDEGIDQFFKILDEGVSDSDTDRPEDWEWASTDEEDLMSFDITLEEHQAPAPVQQKKEREPGISPETNLVVVAVGTPQQWGRLCSAS